MDKPKRLNSILAAAAKLHRPWRFRLVSLAVATAACSLTPVFAIQNVSRDRAIEQDAADSTPSVLPNDSRERITAEDVLRTLQRQRPRNRPIAAASLIAGERNEGPQLWPEGYSIVDRAGHMIRSNHDSRWWTMDFGTESDVQPLKLLPNAMLQPMARTIEGGLDDMGFEVSGEITEFEGENYMLIRFAARPARKTVEEDASTASANHDANSAPRADTNPAKEQIPQDAAVDDVLKLLQGEVPDREPVSMSAVSPAFTPEETVDSRPALSMDGTPIVERPGRLVRQAAWWVFAFESDHPVSPEPPMKLLPNKVLEEMIETGQGGADGLVFIASGQTTVFENENYFLLRTARRRPSTGNLRK